eukprot:ANDGO_01944.mRNA.1 SNF1-related protein kinase catalytic subunit alpha KIN10
MATTQAEVSYRIGPYKLGQTLGKGSFGKVKLGEHEKTGYKVAVKILNRQKIKTSQMDKKIRREINILKLFRHPHIIRLYEVIETKTDIFLIMEYVSGGELFDYIVTKGKLSEDEARKFFQQIISGVEYCHRFRVVHRDLKPENLLLDGDRSVKIADFGLSNMMHDGDFLKTSCGSPNYAAPEVISGKLYAGPEVDVWSCGVILYALLCGRLPFDEETIPSLFRKIREGEYAVPHHLSPGARDLISKILVVDPLRRITISDIQSHPWFQTNLPQYLSLSVDMDPFSSTAIDELVLAETSEKMYCDPETAREYIQKEVINDVTVAYNLLLDAKLRAQQHAQNGVVSPQLAASPPHAAFLNISDDIAESMGSSYGGTSGLNPVETATTPNSVVEGGWHLGIHSRHAPMELMEELYTVCERLQYDWRSLGEFHIKVRCPGGGDPDDTQEDIGSEDEELRGRSTYRNTVTVGVMLFAVPEGGYLLEFRKMEGTVFRFMEVCASLHVNLCRRGVS